ncbi:NADH:flavin oxidoreductase|nr:NADH:flavin oxidoreductase [Candidatus Bathyarchaeota archaeon]
MTFEKLLSNQCIMPVMSILFKPFKIRDLEIRNRFMRSATTSAYADEDGILRDPIISLYERLSKGQIGLIVKGHLYVQDKGKAHTGMAGISHDNHIPRLKELTEAVHQHGVHIVAQINHAGVVHQPDRAGPSVYSEDDWVSREMSVDEIEATVEAYGDAADRAMQAGFDGVQIHGAHGYLVSQFLSRLVNQRDDRYGGSLDKRTRFLIEVYDEVRKRVGNEPVLIKINCDDFSPEGFTVEDCISVCKKLAEKGIDHIEISGGGRGSQTRLRERAKHGDAAYSELAFAGHMSKIRKELDFSPMGLVYGFRNLDTMKKAVSEGLTDMVSMSRPFIREPYLVDKLSKGQSQAECIRCDACRAYFGKEMMRCLLE